MRAPCGVASLLSSRQPGAGCLRVAEYRSGIELGSKGARGKRSDWHSGATPLSGCEDEADVILELIDLPPSVLQALNGPSDEDFLARLTASMSSNGWGDHRPLLVEDATRPWHSHPRYFPWTGSHRIEAARRACLKLVPCRVLRQADADQAFVTAGFNLDTYECWRDALGRGARLQESRRHNALIAAGLSEAAELLQAEFGATDGHE
jgi:hypothetical protein